MFNQIASIPLYFNFFIFTIISFFPFKFSYFHDYLFLSFSHFPPISNPKPRLLLISLLIFPCFFCDYLSILIIIYSPLLSLVFWKQTCFAMASDSEYDYDSDESSNQSDNSEHNIFAGLSEDQIVFCPLPPSLSSILYFLSI